MMSNQVKQQSSNRPFKVSRQFSQDFDKVCKYHNCTPEEVEEMKANARADFEAAQECYAMLAKEIDARVGVPEPVAKRTLVTCYATETEEQEAARIMSGKPAPTYSYVAARVAV